MSRTDSLTHPSELSSERIPFPRLSQGASDRYRSFPLPYRRVQGSRGRRADWVHDAGHAPLGERTRASSSYENSDRMIRRCFHRLYEALEAGRAYSMVNDCEIKMSVRVEEGA